MTRRKRSRDWSSSAPATSTSVRARTTIMSCSPTPKATSSASSSRTTPSSLTAGVSDRSRATARGGRILLERSAWMAIGLGSGRRNGDPRAGRHRSIHHLGSAACPEDRGRTGSISTSLRPATSSSEQRWTASCLSGRPESTSAKARSSGWSWPIPRGKLVKGPIIDLGSGATTGGLLVTAKLAGAGLRWLAGWLLRGCPMVKQRASTSGRIAERSRCRRC